VNSFNFSSEAHLYVKQLALSKSNQGYKDLETQNYEVSTTLNSKIRQSLQ